ncbi:MAG: phenylalanine--tRNA ligase subunit beta [Bacteroidetes bacterium]|nr:phenylalanine--tRNA ligase subunit beta [Bacteroidota bacterium]
MKISYNWLSEYIDHGLSPDDLADSLTMFGLEVEKTERSILSLDGVIVGHVQSVSQHPNADRLKICQVDLGNHEIVQIICGASNVAMNQRVPVATVGAKLTTENGKTLEIKKAKIRGQQSMGMICAEDELGLSDNHQGIMVLTGTSNIGESIEEYLHRERGIVSDASFDLAITPNRPDATCHMGIARDLSALLNIPPKFPDITLHADGDEAVEWIDVKIQCPDKCARYSAMIVQDVTVTDSPVWLKQRLESIGLRPVNNIVDVTNFVMFECGQPLHAFNYDQIAQKKIIVRESRAGEKFVTLDGKEHSLNDGIILICDGEQPVALGGIMGGKNSEVSNSTTNILIESAWFDTSRTRRSAKALGISTDASYRFERGVDSTLQPWAAMRAAQLIAELGGGTIVPGIVDIHPRPKPAQTIDLRISRIRKILGTKIDDFRVTQILASLGFQPKQQDTGVISCTIPAYRPDVQLEIDLIEEIVRIHGLENIGISKYSTLQLSIPLPRSEDRLREQAHSHLTGHGFREIYTNSLLPNDLAEQFSHEVLETNYPPVRTLNAASSSMATLRPSLVPGMLMVMQHNTHHSQRVLRFYEFGHLFHQSTDQATFIENYSEYDGLLLGISGPVQPENWDGNTRITDFFDLKGEVSQLLDTLRLNTLEMQFNNQASKITEYHITLYSNEIRLGAIAKLSREIQASYDLPDPVFFAEFNWTRLTLLHENAPDPTYEPVSPFPVVERDLAVSVDRSQPVAPMITALQKAGIPLLKDIKIFDVYTGNRIPKNQKSIAFALRFGTNRTLRDHEVDQFMKKFVNVLFEQFDATLRN